MTLFANVFMGVAAFLGSIFGIHHLGFGNGQSEDASNTAAFEHRMGSSTPAEWEARAGLLGTSTPGIVGKVTSINGNTLTVVGRSRTGTASTTYTVDASNATVFRMGAGTTTVASIKTGDAVAVGGTISGTSITAKTILDGLLLLGPHGEGEGSSTAPAWGARMGDGQNDHSIFGRSSSMPPGRPESDQQDNQQDN